MKERTNFMVEKIIHLIYDNHIRSKYRIPDHFELKHKILTSEIPYEKYDDDDDDDNDEGLDKFLDL